MEQDHTEAAEMREINKEIQQPPHNRVYRYTGTSRA